MGIIDGQIALFPGKAVAVTEYSNPRPGASVQERGQHHLEFIEAMSQRPSVEAMTAFIASGQHFGIESFVDNPGLAEIVGRRSEIGGK